MPMSQAYASTLNISLEVRGNLPVRQIRHWAGDLMLVSITASLPRGLLHRRLRKPREVIWLIGVTMFALAMVEGFPGYSLPDDSCPAPASGSPGTSWKGSRSRGPT